MRQVLGMRERLFRPSRLHGYLPRPRWRRTIVDMDGRLRCSHAGGVEVVTPHGEDERRRSRSYGNGFMPLVVALGVAALVGCVSGGPGSYSEDQMPTASEDGDRVTNSDSGSSTRDVSFEELTDNPMAFVGSRIRVTGSVFFHSVCPPPGATDAPCVLLGYLTDPTQRTFIAADESRALALAEGGSRLSCEESVASGRACPGWSADSTYTLEGVLEHQVLGGRKTDLVQLDVETKGEPQAW